MSTSIPHPDAQRAFEEKYQRSAQDPASAEMLSIWNDAWDAATERAAKACEAENVEELTDGDLAYNMATRHCAAAIRGSGRGEG